MPGPYVDTSHNYNLHCPDATFTLASVDGQDHRLVVWKACGARDRLRIQETLQKPGEPAFPTGYIRYLCISRDVVFPMYAVTEYRAREWNIEVRYDGGGESVIYPFVNKQQALEFQSMVTGYDVAACFENTSIYLTYRQHTNPLLNALRTRSHPELEGLGEIQLWKRKPPAAESGALSPVGSPRTASSGTGTEGQRKQRVSDTLSLCTDAAGQQFYLASHVPNPILVMFVKDFRLGGYTMLRTDLPPLASGVKSTSVVLGPHVDGRAKTFSVRQLTATSDGLARWNVCAMGAISKVPALDSLEATTLTLGPRNDDPRDMEEYILQLQVDFAQRKLERTRAKNATQRNEEPEGALGARKASIWSSGSSSSGSMVGMIPRALSVRRNFQALEDMMPTNYLSAEARAARSGHQNMMAGAIELDGRSITPAR